MKDIFLHMGTQLYGEILRLKITEKAKAQLSAGFRRGGTDGTGKTQGGTLLTLLRLRFSVAFGRPPAFFCVPGRLEHLEEISERCVCVHESMKQSEGFRPLFGLAWLITHA